MHQLKKMVSQIFDELDDSMKYCQEAIEHENDSEMANMYSDVAYMKADSASMLSDATAKYTMRMDVNNDDIGKASKYAWDILSEIIEHRIEYVREQIASVRR